MIEYAQRKKTRVRIIAGERVNWVENSKRASYITRMILSTPPWVSNVELQVIKLRMQWLTEATGIQHNIDHIVPLSHPLVCGLTVPWNLRIIPRAPNLSKGNDWDDGAQRDMFEFAGQSRMFE